MNLYPNIEEPERYQEPPVYCPCGCGEAYPDLCSRACTCGCGAVDDEPCRKETASHSGASIRGEMMDRTLYRQYRKKPVVIEAVLWDGTNVDEVLDLAETRASLIRTTLGNLLIETLEGTMTANRGDYIIRGVKGEVYPCKPDIFAVTYDRVLEATA